MTVSICIPAYNAEKTLAEVLQSVVSQTYSDMDIVVIDNASTDATPNIIHRFEEMDPRVRHVRFEELVHGHNNFTRCFNAARGDLMAIYHADDLYHPTIVEEQVALLRQRPDIGAVFTKGGRVDEHGAPLGSPFPIPDAIFNGPFAEFDFAGAFRAVLQYGHILLTPSAMARTRIYRDEIQKWPYPEFGGSADLYVFLTIARRHKIAILNKTLMDYRTGRISASFHYARQRRKRHDIFETLGYFVENGGSKLMAPTDWANYEFLQLKDDINIAVSYLIDGDRSYARALSSRLWSPRNIAAALRYGRHTKILLGGYCAWILSFIPLGPSGRRILSRLRFG